MTDFPLKKGDSAAFVLPPGWKNNPDLALKDLGAFWVIKGTRNGEVGKCRNCWQVQKIKHLGLCVDCFASAVNVRGKTMLDALSQTRTLFISNMTDNTCEPHQIKAPIIKKSVAVEFGDAEMEFRVKDKKLDIRVEDGGDLVFMARNVDISVLQSVMDMLS